MAECVLLHPKYFLNKIVLIIGDTMFHKLSSQNSVTETNFKQDFFNEVAPIILVDPLAATLGAIDASEPYVYNYKDIIKFSGHSCPTVSGAYKMTQLALKELYGDDIPVRGDIRITIKGAPDEKVNGPISQVISFITGAAGETGFKGIGGKFNRFNLMVFEHDNPSENGILAEAIFERVDNGKKVSVEYNASAIPSNPEMEKIMPLVFSGKASTEEKIKFGDIWQERVRIVLLETPEEAFNIKIIK